MMKGDCYALYQGDKFVDVGTIAEIAERQHVKEDTIKFYGYPCYKKRNKGGDAYELFKLDDE